MDMQGTPIGSTNQGMKNTTDPEAQRNPKYEGAGPVAADSLAAESSRQGGGFASNKHSEPLGVSGSNSTFNNLDTSGAKTLAPAPDAPSRDRVWQESGAGAKYPEALEGQVDSTGATGEGYDTTGAGGAFSSSGADKVDASKISSNIGNASTQTGSRGSLESSQPSASGPTSQSSTSSSVPAAPGYIYDVTQPLNQAKPKGANLTEGGFDEPASANAEIGSNLDPGRLAEASFQKMTQTPAAGSGPNQAQEGAGAGLYDALSK